MSKIKYALVVAEEKLDNYHRRLDRIDEPYRGRIIRGTLGSLGLLVLIGLFFDLTLITIVGLGGLGVWFWSRFNYERFK